MLGHIVEIFVEALGVYLCQLHGVDDAYSLLDVVGRVSLCLLSYGKRVVGGGKLLDGLVLVEVDAEQVVDHLMAASREEQKEHRECS